jgi:hypothetical protein
MGQRSRIEGAQDAIELLLEEHRKLQTMFEDYDRLASQEGVEDDKGRLSAQACAELALCLQIEDQGFYPAARAALGDHDLFDEAADAHQGAGDLMRQLECMEPDDRRYDAQVKLLGELALRHFGIERDEMFPQAKSAGLDLDGVARQMRARRGELLAEMRLAEAPSVEDGMRAAKHASHNGGESASGARK